MRTTTMTSAAAAAGCVVLLLVAGCSKDSSPDVSATATTAELGPLSAYFEKVSGKPGEQDYTKLQKDSEEIVATCMREQGFEYKPQDTSGIVAAVTGEDGAQYGTEEFAQQNGYGITSMNGSGDSGDASAKEWVDPNADYVAAMSQTEQAAYYAALYGEQATMTEAPDPDATADTYDWQKSGCQGKASHEVYDTGMGAAFQDETFVSLQDEISKVWEGLQNDPKMSEINAAWSTCMSDAGFDFATAEDAVTSISDKMSALYTDTATETTDTTATAAPAEPDAAAVAALHAEEIKTAVADAKCKKSVDYDKKVQKIQVAAEQAFVDAHKAELDAWSEKYAQAAK